MESLSLQQLQEYAAAQERVQQQIQDDGNAITDMVMRVAQPVIDRVRGDSSALENMVNGVAQPIHAQLKSDRKAITKMATKLANPLANSIGEDRTVLTGMLARLAQSGFPNAQSPGHNPGSNPMANPVGQRKPGRPGGPGSAYQGAAPVGMPSAAQTTPLRRPGLGDRTLLGDENRPKLPPTPGGGFILNAGIQGPPANPPGNVYTVFARCQAQPPDLVVMSIYDQTLITAGPLYTRVTQQLWPDYTSASQWLRSQDATVLIDAVCQFPPPGGNGSGSGTAGGSNGLPSPPVPPFLPPVPPPAQLDTLHCNICDAVVYASDAFMYGMALIAKALSCLCPPGTTPADQQTAALEAPTWEEAPDWESEVADVAPYESQVTQGEQTAVATDPNALATIVGAASQAILSHPDLLPGE